jgi:glycerol-3-phosphate acyltransferase PlsX
MRVAVDAMGGDQGPAAVLAGASAFLDADDDTVLILVGRPEDLEEHLKTAKLDGHPRVRTHPASQVIGMDEKLLSIRQKPDSSVLRAVELVRDGEADAVVAIGNSLAAVAGCTLRLRLIENVHRAGIAVPLPSKSGTTVVIDMGANTTPRVDHFVDYAVMASVYASEVLNIENPRVGLLNVGEELSKGDDLLREAHDRLTEAPVNFVGNVEGGDIYRGTCDIAVCDGLVGNIVLKASEAAAELIVHFLRQELGRSAGRKLGALLCRGAFRDLWQRIDYAEFGGAPLLGVKGAAIIGHGRSDARAVANAIRVARDSAARDVTGKIRDRLRQLARPDMSAAPGSEPSVAVG